jgi:hypothetical protein
MPLTYYPLSTCDQQISPYLHMIVVHMLQTEVVALFNVQRQHDLIEQLLGICVTLKKSMTYFTLRRR